jgi:hypothetical protein
VRGAKRRCPRLSAKQEGVVPTQGETGMHRYHPDVLQAESARHVLRIRSVFGRTGRIPLSQHDNRTGIDHHDDYDEYDDARWLHAGRPDNLRSYGVLQSHHAHVLQPDRPARLRGPRQWVLRAGVASAQLLRWAGLAYLLPGNFVSAWARIPMHLLRRTNRAVDRTSVTPCRSWGATSLAS